MSKERQFPIEEPTEIVFGDVISNRDNRLHIATNLLVVYKFYIEGGEIFKNAEDEEIISDSGTIPLSEVHRIVDHWELERMKAAQRRFYRGFRSATEENLSKLDREFEEQAALQIIKSIPRDP